jgi:excinuclease ABC subunit C
MNDQLKAKLKTLPTTPGVYFHKDNKNQIIYVGKAANLKNRVRSYFQNSKNRDPKTASLVSEIHDTDWVELASEMEALFFEGEMIRRYLPKYNILLRDDKSLAYIRIDLKNEYPTVTTTRRPLDDKAEYFGPYLSSVSVNKALRLLRKVFPFAIKKTSQTRASLDYYLGLDPGLEENKTSLEEYRKNLKKLIQVIKGNRKKIEADIEQEMLSAAASKNFELAKKKRNQLYSLKQITKQVIFSQNEFLEISKDHALNELVTLLGLEKFPKRIEGYDISHQQGTDVVASMVVFTNGITDKGNYRKFKTSLDINNDFKNMAETLRRRLSDTNIKKWGRADLILIDGGKGQLDSAIKSRDELGDKTPMIGLAKREEQIVIYKEKSLVNLNDKYLEKLNGFKTETDNFILLNVPHTTNLIKLLQRIRDESHRFAVSYHSSLKRSRQTKSDILDIPGIGPKTRKDLIKTYGSLKLALERNEGELAKIVGDSKAKIIKGYYKNDK